MDDEVKEIGRDCIMGTARHLNFLRRKWETSTFSKLKKSQRSNSELSGISKMGEVLWPDHFLITSIHAIYTISHFKHWFSSSFIYFHI